MYLFYCPELGSLGPGPNLYYRAVAETIHMMRQIQQKCEDEGVKLSLPPRKNTLSSRIVPRLAFPQEKRHLLEDFSACPVPDEYMKVLFWLRKKEFCETEMRDPLTTKMKTKLDSELRARVVNLIFSEEWILETDDPGLQLLNTRLKNLDLGRYTGLKPGLQIPEKFQKMRENYRQIQLKEDKQRKVYQQHSLEAKKLNESPETPFQRAARLRREQGLGDY